MAAQPSSQKSSSRWGSFLANVESRLDTILADEDTLQSKSPSTSTKPDGRAQEQPSQKKDAMTVPTVASGSSVSRTSSTNRAQDRLNEKLARAMANRNLAKKAEGSPSTSDVPSRTASPANVAESPRESGESQREQKSSDEQRTSIVEVGPPSELPVANGIKANGDIKPIALSKDEIGPNESNATEPTAPAASNIHKQIQEDLAAVRNSVDSHESGSTRISMDATGATSLFASDSPESNGVDTTSKSMDEHLGVIAQLKSDNEAAELRRQEEVHDYLERIDAMQAKLQYLTKEATEIARNAAAEADSGSSELKIAEKDEKIALLIEEGQKLSQTELKHMSIIKKLRAKSTEDDKAVNDTKRASEKHQRAAADAQERMKRAEAAERLANERARNLPKLEKELDSLKTAKNTNDTLVRDLQFQLSEATSSAKEAEERARVEALEEERIKAADLRDELSSLKIEKDSAEKAHQNELRELREKSEREKERSRVAEIERQAEQDALESKLEAYRARAEEASVGQGGDVQAKLLRQIETLQNQYAVASENWQGIEGSLLSRVTALEKERDDVVKRESEIRRKARETNTKARRLEEDLERANARIGDLDVDLSSKSSQISTIQERLTKAGADLSSAQTDFKAEREAFEAHLSTRLEEERVKVREEILRSPPESLYQQRTESPVQKTRRSSNADRTSPAQSRRLQATNTNSGLMASINGQSPFEKSMSRRSSNNRIFSGGSDYPSIPPPVRTDSMSTVPQLSVNNGIPETPSIHELKDDDGYFDDIPTPATPDRTINDLISVSTAGAGPSVQLVERMSAAVRRLESEKAAHKDELQRLVGQRDEAREQVVELMKDNGSKKAVDDKLRGIEKELSETKERYLTTLEMLGEKSEKVEELKADVDDLKGMYRELVERTTR